MERTKTLLVMVAALSMAPSVPAHTSRIAAFTIEFDLSADGLLMRCTDGCAWETFLVENCSTAKACRFVLNQRGDGAASVKPEVP